MVIYNYFDNSDINIYFHMKNHYKRLKSARSTIDNSFPQSFIKACNTPPNSQRSLTRGRGEQRVAGNAFHSPLYSSRVRKHKSVTSESGPSDTSLKNIPLQSKPKMSRNKSFEIPLKMQYVPKSKFLGLNGRKTGLNKTKKKKLAEKKVVAPDNKSESDCTGNYVIDYPLGSEDINRSDTNASLFSQIEEKISKQARVEEHEYLQFLLRITEDIITNNLYTNDDIENIFQAHVEANKDHLNMEKMEAHLMRLCIELDIPYKGHSNNMKLEECYEHFFASCSSSQFQKLEDCECTVQRILDINDKESKKTVKWNGEKQEDTEFYLQNMFNIIAHKCKLEQVAECTESDNSLDKLELYAVKSMKNFSETSIQGNNIFSCLENLDISGEHSNEKFNQDNVQCSDNRILSNELDLTDKEKIGCMEEDILFQKLDCNVISQLKETFTSSTNSNIENCTKSNKNSENSEMKIPIIKISKENVSNYLLQKPPLDPYLNQEDDVDTLAENLNTVYVKCIENGSISNHDFEVENISDDVFSICTKYNKEDRNCKNKELMKADETPIKDDPVDSSEEVHSKLVTQIIENIPIPKLTTNDQYTQIDIAHCDKQCSTSLLLNEHPKSEYVLVNGPMYVLKSVLDSEDKLIIYNRDTIEKTTDNKKTSSTELCTNCSKVEVTQNYHIIPDFPSYSKDDFTKLLNSDYDLMPQRDGDITDKYHHLFVDATTSTTNLHLNKSITSVFVNPNSLLLSDKYEITSLSQKEENFIPESGCEVVENRHTENDLSLSNQCVLENHSLPHRKNSFLKFPSEVYLHPETPELDVSLTSHELYSQSTVRKTDISKSGEIVKSITYTEEVSQASTFGSDNEKTSTTSSPNRSYILGKRKLKHPS